MVSVWPRCAAPFNASRTWGFSLPFLWSVSRVRPGSRQQTEFAHTHTRVRIRGRGIDVVYQRTRRERTTCSGIQLIEISHASLIRDISLALTPS